MNYFSTFVIGFVCGWYSCGLAIVFVLRHRKSPPPGAPGSVFSTEPIPQADIDRAAALAQERGWKDKP